MKQKITVKNTKGSQAFSVPNTPEGLEFIKTLRKYKSDDCTIRVLGRGSRKEYAKTHGRMTAQSSVPKHLAEWFAVYTHSAIKNKRILDLVNEKWQAIKEAKALKFELEISKSTIKNQATFVSHFPQLESDIKIARGDVQQLQTLNETLRKENFNLDSEWGKAKREVSRLLIELNRVKTEFRNKALDIPVKDDKVNSITITVPKGLTIKVMEG